MRKVLLALLALGAISAGDVQAAPVIGPAPLVDEAPQVQSVQYYGRDWRFRQHLRHERFEHRQRAREFRHWQRRPLPYYGYGPPGYRPGYRQFGHYGRRW